MHKSYFYGEPDDYIQVVAHKEKCHGKLIEMGFRRSVNELTAESITTQNAKQEDTGSVSVEDLVKLVESSDSKDDIASIVRDAKGIDIDKRGGLDAVKKKAIAVLTGESDES